MIFFWEFDNHKLLIAVAICFAFADVVPVSDVAMIVGSGFGVVALASYLDFVLAVGASLLALFPISAR